VESLVDLGCYVFHNERMTRSTDNTEGSLTKEQEEILQESTKIYKSNRIICLTRIFKRAFVITPYRLIEINN